MWLRCKCGCARAAELCDILRHREAHQGRTQTDAWQRCAASRVNSGAGGNAHRTGAAHTAVPCPTQSPLYASSGESSRVTQSSAIGIVVRLFTAYVDAAGDLAHVTLRREEIEHTDGRYT